MTRTFTFNWAIPFVRFVKFRLEGTHTLPDWHASAGGTFWGVVDEIVAR